MQFICVVTAIYTLSFLMAENPSSVCFGCLRRNTHHSNFIQNFLVHFLVRKVMIAFFHSMKLYGRHFSQLGLVNKHWQILKPKTKSNKKLNQKCGSRSMSRSIMKKKR